MTERRGHKSMSGGGCMIKYDGVSWLLIIS